MRTTTRHSGECRRGGPAGYGFSAQHHRLHGGVGTRAITREPVVSIIVGNYNYGQFLREAVDSALHQTYVRTEVIVVDDGSTDHSPQVIASYGDRIIPLLKENGGQASAFNAGFARCRGDIVIFLDADDRLLPDTAQRVVQAFGAQPDAAKVQYPMEMIDARGVPTGVVKPPAHRALSTGDLRRHILAFPDDLNWMATSGNAFAAWVLREILPIPEPSYRPVGADWYVGHLAALFGHVAALDAVGAYFRVHEANNYEREARVVDLGQVRQSILYAYTTHRYIEQVAVRLGLVGDLAQVHPVLSVSHIANRMVSLKLDPRRHPIREDTLRRLLRAGLVAASRRFDVAWPLRVLYVVWFAAMVPAPRPVARRLAEWFLVPQTRGRFNTLLARLVRQA